MNAIDPVLADPAPLDMASPGPPPADLPIDLTRRALAPLRWTGLLLLILFVALAGLWAAAPTSTIPALVGLRSTRLIPVALAALTLGLAGLCGAAILASARLRALDPAPTPRRTRLRLPRRTAGDAARIGRAARWPQVLLVAPLALAVIVLAALPLSGPAPAPTVAIALGAVAILLAFPLLVAERSFAAMPAVRLPEAPAVRRLLLIPVLAWPLAGLIQIAGGLGLTIAPVLETLLAIVLAVIAAELALRAAARGSCRRPPRPKPAPPSTRCSPASSPTASAAAASPHPSATISASISPAPGRSNSSARPRCR